MVNKKSSIDGHSEKPCLTQMIYEGLRDEIVTGKIEPGACLSRRQIASRYGSSYIPVLEALIRLERTGLVEAEANQMARVRKISIEAIQNDYVLREAYETQAARLACLAATEQEFKDLYTLAEAVDARAPDTPNTPDSTPEGLLLHWQFHKRIAELSRFPVLVRELERIDMLERLRANWYYSPYLSEPPNWHSLLVDALQSRNPDKAEMVMRDHIQKGLEKELLGYRMRKHT